MIKPVSFLSEFFRRDERTIQLWVKEWEERYGINVRIDRGEYSFTKCCDCRIRDLEREIDRLEMGDENKYELEKINLRLRNEEKEIQLKKLRNDIVEIELVKMAWTNEVSIFKRAVQALPGILATRLEGVSEYSRRLKIITDETNQVLYQLSGMQIIEDELKTMDELDTYDQKAQSHPGE